MAKRKLRLRSFSNAKREGIIGGKRRDLKENKKAKKTSTKRERDGDSIPVECERSFFFQIVKSSALFRLMIKAYRFEREPEGDGREMCLDGGGPEKKKKKGRKRNEKVQQVSRSGGERKESAQHTFDDKKQCWSFEPDYARNYLLGNQHFFSSLRLTRTRFSSGALCGARKPFLSYARPRNRSQFNWGI